VIAPIQSSAFEPAYLRRIRARAKLRVAWLRRIWAEFDAAPPSMATTHAEVDRILEPARLDDAEKSFFTSDAAARLLSVEVAASDEAFASDHMWTALRSDFGLSNEELDLLSLTLASESDADLGRVYAYLQDDPSQPWPTPVLAADLFGWGRLAPLGPGCGLVSWGLAKPAETAPEPWLPTAAWRVEPALAGWVAGGRAVDPDLAGGLRLQSWRGDMPKACLYQAELDRMRGFVEAITNVGRAAAVELEIVGPEGSGRRTLAAQLAATWGLRLLLADTASILPADLSLEASRARVRRCLRSARLENALLCWEVRTPVDNRVWEATDASGSVSLFALETSRGGGSRAGCPRLVTVLRPLTGAARTELWSTLSDQPLPDRVSGWALTPAQLCAAAEAAPAGVDAVLEACRQALQPGAEELLAPMPCPYTWDDIVLEPSLARHLHEFETQAKLRSQVLDEWGFSRLSPLSRGVSALLAGPSGTGKTMSAQVIARSLGMDLLRVDLAGVVNKYIGETEKRLKRVFDACERANVVLLFDEADALFGRRTQVKDAHDRYANIEIDYLLQRMERFDGIAILSTNRKSDVDQAFLRRLRFVIDFTPPGPEERTVLWRLALPRALPDGTALLEDIDFEALGQRLALNGAGIKSAALAAAFLARSMESRISTAQVLHAARREMAKNGLELRAEGFA
jgi:hypothetical protein